MGKQRLKAQRRYVAQAREAKIVKHFVDAARQLFPHVFTPDCCINATWVAIEALRAMHIDAKPIATEFAACNKVAKDIASVHGWPNESNREAWTDTDAWIMTIDESSPGDGYKHHLVCTTQYHLIDASIGQFDRPAKNVPMPPALAISLPAKTRNGFMAGSEPIGLCCDNGASLVYKPNIDETDYWFASGFQSHDGNHNVLRAVLHWMNRCHLN